MAALQQFREQHLRDWVDEPIPALDGFTPHQAATLLRTRPKLKTILKEIEQGEADLPEAQHIDVRWLWDALGFKGR